MCILYLVSCCVTLVANLSIDITLVVENVSWNIRFILSLLL